MVLMKCEEADLIKLLPTVIFKHTFVTLSCLNSLSNINKDPSCLQIYYLSGLSCGRLNQSHCDCVPLTIYKVYGDVGPRRPRPRDLGPGRGRPRPQLRIEISARE